LGALLLREGRRGREERGEGKGKERAMSPPPVFGRSLRLCLRQFVEYLYYAVCRLFLAVDIWTR